jgi:CRP/FNR family transcriptional regulator, cyclic AMP receptor protein
MNGIDKRLTDPPACLMTPGPGRRIVQLTRKQPVFAQGDPADSIFYLQSGRAKVTVVSKTGKEATITLLGEGDFMGEEAISGEHAVRLTSVTAISSCTAIKIRRDEMLRMLHEERSFADFFLHYMLRRQVRIQADLLDQLFNSSEKRLARILLLMADFEKSGAEELIIPKISQETLAEMIGTTRSRVSFFMNRFRKRGFIEYNGRIQVRKSLVNVLAHEPPPTSRTAPRGEMLLN